MKHKIRPSIVLLNNDSVLLMKYIYGGTEVYGLPGGNPEVGESLQQAVVRELKEELGLTIEIDDLLFVAETHRVEKQEVVVHNIFAGKIVAGVPVLNAIHTSALSAEWINVDDLDDKNLYPNIGAEIKILFGFGSSDRTTYLGNINQQWF
ncbi:NUDIX domain-containing protein [Solitalea canadensis]|uniref:ADP-ribose pyrophosphatase n=1 Tax=Solitalea canadensis (strain ATCC 29591 / DSM 3403 / JCM 21819 / LMG 8368 / NBRC 15130 / NCIMB 12057 / USAM 9D) TaxID=929556 RepID=H8KPB7_SOLCM|nr:NUDIX domain-containing protein [Solitalea canadensis]AFD05815.1 ADP-ribose pyrophosphatase [Solitalea canadensis DSM 3403]